MHVDLEVLSQIAFGCVALYLLWDRNNMVDRIRHLEQQHNKLCDSVADFSEQVEDEVNKLYDTMENKDA